MTASDKKRQVSTGIQRIETQKAKRFTHSLTVDFSDAVDFMSVADEIEAALKKKGYKVDKRTVISLTVERI